MKIDAMQSLLGGQFLCNSVVEVIDAQPMMIDYAQPLLSNENIDWVVAMVILFFPLIATGELWGRLPSNV